VQLALLNAVRQSLGKNHGTLKTWLGGALIHPEDWQTKNLTPGSSEQGKFKIIASLRVADTTNPEHQLWRFEYHSLRRT
jgi:hypothetical protein